MISIFLNEKNIEIPENSKLIDIIDDSSLYDVYIFNGFQLKKDIAFEKVISDGDRIVLIKKESIPSKEEYYSLLTSRNSPEVQEKISNSIVGIAGCGGLGSNIAIALARTGIKKLVIADFDTVEPSNLNRQQYFFENIGMYKVDALESIIKKFNPYVVIEKHNIFLDDSNTKDVFKDCEIVAEAFDSVSSKHMILHRFSENDLSHKYLVTASGLAGFDSSNLIKTMKLSNNIYLCGDTISGAKEFSGLMCPRVLIAAGHQANKILRLINEKYEV